MPKQERFRNPKYSGVYYIEAQDGERIFYIQYRRPGSRKLIEEKAGKQKRDDMSFARAARLRAMRIEGNLPTNEERREEARAQEQAERERWTVDRLWGEYVKGRKQNHAFVSDKNRYERYLKDTFGRKEPKEILALDLERLKRRMQKEGKSPQTVKHVLNLLTWIVNFGRKNGLCEGLSFHVSKPKVNNVKTEDLSPDELERLLEEIEKDDHAQAGPLLKMALYSGMRKGELFRLKWADLDFDRGFINIIDPKGGKDVVIPMNELARDLLENHPKVENSEFVFPGKNGGQRRNVYKFVNRIKARANLPKEFRIFHGLRHVFASTLASSGQVDMYQLQKLLGHKSPLMTQRYSHLRDQALRDASNVMADAMNSIKLRKK